MATKVELFETEDGQQFKTQAEADAHEAKLAAAKEMLAKYGATHTELVELLNKAQLLLDTKPELAKLKEYLDDNGNRIDYILSDIEDYNGEKDENLNYQSSYYSSNC